jgi:hypothetical protein
MRSIRLAFWSAERPAVSETNESSRPDCGFEPTFRTLTPANCVL